jgi:CheY-like chemotaxis protein
LDGTISVESELDMGSIFTLRVPLVVIVPESKEVAVTPLRVVSTRALKVLVIDDDVLSAFLLHKQLSAFGAEAVVAHSCAEARPHLFDGLYDAIFVDNRLPDGRGLTLIQELRARTERSGFRPRIVSCSGGLDRDEIGSYCAVGVDLFLPKPIAPDSVLEVLNSCRQSATAA